MRIIGGAWRGRRLLAPPGDVTRPTADRARQALFDRLAHAPWADPLAGATVLDVFAGTGALGLEALSRGAAAATFIEQDREALGVLRANIAACAAGPRARVVAADAVRPPRGEPHQLILLDPPYGQDLVPRAVAALGGNGWLAPDALVVAELGRDEQLDVPALADWTHGAARMLAWRQP